MRAQFLILIEVIVLVTYWIYTGRYYLNNIEDFEYVTNKDYRNISRGFSNYVTCSFDHFSGLGNQLFRIASLYGIGRNSHRRVYFTSNLPSVRRAFVKFDEYFPNINYNVIKLFNTTMIKEKVVPFGMKDRLYDDPKRIMAEKIKFLKIGGNYIQSYKYFDQYQADVRHIFACRSSAVIKMKYAAELSWGNDWSKNSHNLCVHTRRRDFLTISHFRASSKRFTDPAVKLLVQTLQSSGHGNVNVIYFGDDPAFVGDLYKGPQKDVQFLTMSALKQTDIDELCFAANNCDTVLLTATGSTYGWWLAYLKEKPGNIYYDGILTNRKVNGWNINDYVPPNWHRICVDSGIPRISHRIPCQRP